MGARVGVLFGVQFNFTSVLLVAWDCKRIVTIWMVKVHGGYRIYLGFSMYQFVIIFFKGITCSALLWGSDEASIILLHIIQLGV